MEQTHPSHPQDVETDSEIVGHRPELRTGEQALGHLHEKLQSHKANVEEFNTALKVLLKYREKEQSSLEETVVLNIKTLILPCVEALRHTRLDEKQRVLVNLIATRMDEIVSSYITKLTSTYASFTPKEIQVALFIKDGKTTKEIAAILDVSSRAIDFHRYNIRKKLGLVKRNQNLRAHLLSLT